LIREIRHAQGQARRRQLRGKKCVHARAWTDL
jgi:hypothetical protein